MSAEVTISLGVAGRVLANIACASNPRLGAALVGLSNGFLIHRAWVAQTLFDPLTLLILAAGLAFDHTMYGGFENTVTSVLACGLGVVLADFGPDLWYEFVGEDVTKEMARELEALGLGSFGNGYDSESDVDDRSEVGSVVSRSSRRTSRTGTSATVRPSRLRPRPIPHQAPSTITRFSRVTFDESSITQSQSDDADVDVEDLLTTTNGDALSTSTADDLYMEPSSTSVASSSRTIIQPVRRPSILRRLHIPGQGEGTTNTATNATTTTLPSASSESTSSSSRTRLTSDGEATPRATVRPGFTPLSPPSGFEPGPPLPSAVPSFPEPDLSSSSTSTSTTFEEYSPRIIPPSEPTPDLTASIPLPEPVYFAPGPSAGPSHFTAAVVPGYEVSPGEKHDSGPSRFMQMMNVPIVPHSPPPEERVHHQNGHDYRPSETVRAGTPESARLSIPPALQAGPRSRSRSGSRTRSRSRSPAGPRPQPPPQYESLSQPSVQAPGPAMGAYGPPEYISETFEDSTVDVRDLTREDAIKRIEEAWKNVVKKRHRRLNILVKHDDEELESRKNSTFHLMEDLENLRFNFKIRPGIIIVTSRSRG